MKEFRLGIRCFLKELCESMCYVVAKDRNKQGCVALKSRIGKHLSEYTRSLNDALLRDGIQIIVISRPTAYGEYAPYSFVDSMEI